MQLRGFKYCLMKHDVQNKQDSDPGRKENLDNL